MPKDELNNRILWLCLCKILSLNAPLLLGLARSRNFLSTVLGETFFEKHIMVNIGKKSKFYFHN